MFVQNLLAPNGFTDVQLEEIIRDDLRLRKVRDLVGSTIDVTPAEFRTVYVQNHQKTVVSLIRMNVGTFAAAVTPTEEEVAKYFEEHKAAFTTSEQRVVSFVELGLTEEEKQLSGKEKVDALQKVSDRANDFGQALLDSKEAGFDEVAKKFGAEVKTTPEFTEGTPAPELKEVPQGAIAAFRLTEAEPNSDAIQTENGFYILHLEKVIPSRPLSLDEARPGVIAQIKNERGHEKLVSTANEVRAKVEEALKAGKSFEEAAAAAGQKSESFPAFSLSEPPSNQAFASEIAEKSVELAEGGLSEFVPTAEGGLLIHLDRREPIDEAKFAKDQEAQLNGLRMRKRFAAFREWLNLRRKAANVQNLSEPQGGRS
jgi:hypothetical protein